MDALTVSLTSVSNIQTRNVGHGLWGLVIVEDEAEFETKTLWSLVGGWTPWAQVSLAFGAATAIGTLVAHPSFVIEGPCSWASWRWKQEEHVHQQTFIRLLGAPEHQEHWEHWESISLSRNDQQCHFLVRSCQESHDLSGASPPFQEWLEVLDLPDCI